MLVSFIAGAVLTYYYIKATTFYVVKKPAVYLYPIDESVINVSLSINGKLTASEPYYNQGWNVNVKPNGLIDGRFDYLFYEAALKKIALPEDGWVVEYKNLDRWFDRELILLGLNEKEKSQFKEYWLKELPKADYYEIRLLQDDFLNENMGLDIKPKPDNLIRVNLHFKPVSTKTSLAKPVIKTPHREGFVVVEWGGILAEG
jgi:hypothetical protein